MSEITLVRPVDAEISGKPTLVTDAMAMVGRSLRLSRRNLEVLLTSLMLPVILMLMFVYLFGGAIHTGTAYVSYVVPGVLVLCAGFGSASTAVSVSQDMHGGIMDRFRSMGVNGAAVLSGPCRGQPGPERGVDRSGLRSGIRDRLPLRRRTAGLARGRRDTAACSSSPSPGSPRWSDCWPDPRRRPTVSPSS